MITGVAAHKIQPSSRALATAVRKASSSISWSSVLVRRRLPSRDLSVENLVAASVETAN
jgi:hypothetical protein